MKRAVGYIRISKQEAHSISLDMQASKVRSYCELHDLNLVTIEQDAGLSGRSVIGRPAIQNVIELVQSGSVEHVVIMKLDRLARNTRDALEIADLLQKMNVSLHSVSEKLDTSTASGKLFYTIISAMSEWERQTIRERTKAALCRKKEQGQWLGKPPYGWILQGGQLAEQSSEQEVIAKVVALKSRG